MSDEVVTVSSPVASPTGLPVMGPLLVKVAFAVVAICGVLAQTLPAHTIAAKVCFSVATILGPILGVASPGLRKAS